jgi:hypothetical protein
VVIQQPADLDDVLGQLIERQGLGRAIKIVYQRLKMG